MELFVNPTYVLAQRIESDENTSLVSNSPMYASSTNAVSALNALEVISGVKFCVLKIQGTSVEVFAER